MGANNGFNFKENIFLNPPNVLAKRADVWEKFFSKPSRTHPLFFCSKKKHAFFERDLAYF